MSKLSLFEGEQKRKTFLLFQKLLLLKPMPAKVETCDVTLQLWPERQKINTDEVSVLLHHRGPAVKPSMANHFGVKAIWQSIGYI